jgi:hypothetical protein
MTKEELEDYADKYLLERFGAKTGNNHVRQALIDGYNLGIGRSEQSCKHPDSCAMGYYHQIGDYYCSKCQKTGLKD